MLSSMQLKGFQGPVIQKSIDVRFLHLGVGLLLLLAAQHAPAVVIPSPECQTQCGDVEIQYPFGIGDKCSWSAHFNITCLVQEDNVHKPFIADLELLNISLIHSTIRVLNPISTYCYDPSSGLMENTTWTFNASGSPYRFSDTEIPKGIGYYEVGFDRGFNTSNIWRFSRCSYAVLMEAEGFNFSTTYINTTKFNDTNIGRAPTVIDWAIRDETTSCEVAKRNETGTYACLSSNSECLVSPNGPGYLCNCSKGYEGNPYVPDGCHGNNCVNIFVQYSFNLV
nr:unnamed protein product [Digitaria exilis]